MVCYIIIYPFWNPNNSNSSNHTISISSPIMASASSNTSSADSKKNDIYYACLDGLATFEPFTADYKGKHVQFVGTFFGHAAGKDIYKLAMKEWGCKCCANRLKSMARLVGWRGPWVSTATTPTTEEFNALGDYMRKHINDNTYDSTPWLLTLIDSEFDKCKTKSVGGFHHYYLAPIIPWSPGPAMTHSDKLLIEHEINSAFGKYGTLIDEMLNRFEPEDWVGIRTSLAHFETVMKRASYANTLAGCLKWFRAIDAMIINRGAAVRGEVITYRNLPVAEKMRVVGTAILSANIKKDEVGWVITVYHQFNDNLLGILQKSKSLAAMEKILTDRFCPTKYQQRTAAPKKQNIQKTIDNIGDFKFTIATCEQIEKYPECIKISNKEPTTSARSMMEAMLAPSVSKYAFADRIKPASPYRPRTLEELNSLIREGKIYKLMIQTTRVQSDCYIAEVEGIDRAYRIAPYAWAFLNEEIPRFTSRVWAKVSHIMPIKYSGHDNYIFCLADAQSYCRNRITTNISWAEYLSTEIRRSCGPTFTAAAKKINISYPENTQHLAIGIGTSIKDSYNNLMTPVTIRINEQPYSITIMKGR